MKYEHYNIIMDIRKLLKSSYDGKSRNGLTLDKSISSKNSKVWYNPETNETYITHKGTQGATDWLNNAVYALGGKKAYRKTKRFKDAQKVQRKAEEKYGTDNLYTLGHSQGGLQAEMLGKRGKQTITYNKATNPFYPSYSNKNQTDIKTNTDIISHLGKTHNENKKEIIVNSLNPLYSHNLSHLKENEYNQLMSRRGGNIKKDFKNFGRKAQKGLARAGAEIGKFTNKQILPGMVTVGMPLASAALGALATGATENPLVGQMVERTSNNLMKKYIPKQYQSKNKYVTAIRDTISDGLNNPNDPNLVNTGVNRLINASMKTPRQRQTITQVDEDQDPYEQIMKQLLSSQQINVNDVESPDIQNNTAQMNHGSSAALLGAGIRKRKYKKRIYRLDFDEAPNVSLNQYLYNKEKTRNRRIKRNTDKLLNKMVKDLLI